MQEAIKQADNNSIFLASITTAVVDSLLQKGVITAAESTALKSRFLSAE